MSCNNTNVTGGKARNYRGKTFEEAAESLRIEILRNFERPPQLTVRQENRNYTNCQAILDLNRPFVEYLNNLELLIKTFQHNGKCVFSNFQIDRNLFNMINDDKLVDGTACDEITRLPSLNNFCNDLYQSLVSSPKTSLKRLNDINLKADDNDDDCDNNNHEKELKNEFIGYYDSLSNLKAQKKIIENEKEELSNEIKLLESVVLEKKNQQQQQQATETTTKKKVIESWEDLEDDDDDEPIITTTTNKKVSSWEDEEEDEEDIDNIEDDDERNLKIKQKDLSSTEKSLLTIEREITQNQTNIRNLYERIVKSSDYTKEKKNILFYNISIILKKKKKELESTTNNNSNNSSSSQDYFIPYDDFMNFIGKIYRQFIEDETKRRIQEMKKKKLMRKQDQDD